MASKISVIRIPPYNYIHVLDTNTNVTSIISGPKTYTIQDHQRITEGPAEMIQIPPRHYVTIENPVLRDEKDGSPLTDSYGQFKLQFGERQIRLPEAYPDPFALYPGEILVGKITAMKIVERNSALKMTALRDFMDGTVKRQAGDEWLFIGPQTYIPRIEADVVKKIKSTIVKHNMALKIRALRECVDHKGGKRQAGEEWLVRDTGAYLPSVDEEIVEQLYAELLTDKKALHLCAIKTFTDVYGIERKAGAEWLVTLKEAETHICDVYETIIGVVSITTLTNRQYCVVLNPVIDGVQHLGREQLRLGEQSFFLLPGEEIPSGIRNIHILADDEAVLLQAKEEFVEEVPVKVMESSSDDGVATLSESGTIKRMPGDRWMVYGPCEYVPPVQVKLLERRKAIPLDENEGIYVRDTKTGHVRAVIGETYMLKPTEVLFEKDLPDEVERLLMKQSLGQTYVVPKERGGGGASYFDDSMASVVGRDKTRVINFRVPHNAAAQVYDYKAKTSRVCFGPDLVCLGPDEQFTMIHLSGDKPSVRM
jgi:major vault protein